MIKLCFILRRKQTYKESSYRSFKSQSNSQISKAIVSFRPKIKISKSNMAAMTNLHLKIKNLSPPQFHRKIHFYAVYLYMDIVNLPLLNSITWVFCWKMGKIIYFPKSFLGFYFWRSSLNDNRLGSEAAWVFVLKTW